MGVGFTGKSHQPKKTLADPVVKRQVSIESSGNPQVSCE